MTIYDLYKILFGSNMILFGCHMILKDLLLILSKNLAVMDSAAISIARENKIPIRIFSILEKNCLKKVV